mmetsp:Transcript_33569/g.85025  ORF Transcript_33569/g.85025 Transcript_33569/m.85025 type:complete len:201 (+) Transcript_33569:583-1185(+)
MHPHLCVCQRQQLHARRHPHQGVTVLQAQGRSVCAWPHQARRAARRRPQRGCATRRRWPAPPGCVRPRPSRQSSSCLGLAGHTWGLGRCLCWLWLLLQQPRPHLLLQRLHQQAHPHLGRLHQHHLPAPRHQLRLRCHLPPRQHQQRQEAAAQRLLPSRAQHPCSLHPPAHRPPRPRRSPWMLCLCLRRSRPSARQAGWVT